MQALSTTKNRASLVPALQVGTESMIDFGTKLVKSGCLTVSNNQDYLATHSLSFFALIM
jgi:hypothetical protein